MNDEKINHLEERMTKLEEDFSEVQRDLKGTAHQPGIFELVRRTNDTVMIQNNTLTQLKTSVDRLNGAKHRMTGIALGAGGVGSILTWLASWFTTKH